MEKFNDKPEFYNRDREPLSDAELQDLFDRYQSDDDAVRDIAADEITTRFYRELLDDQYDRMVEQANSRYEPDYDDYMRSRDGFGSRGLPPSLQEPTPVEELEDFKNFLDREYGEYFMDYTQMDDEELKKTLMKRYAMTRSEANAITRQIRKHENKLDDLTDAMVDAENADDGFASLGKWLPEDVQEFLNSNDDLLGELDAQYYLDNPGSPRPGARDHSSEAMIEDLMANPEKYGFAKDFRKEAIEALKGNGADKDEAERVADYWIENDAIHDEYLKEADGDSLYAMALAYDNYIEAAADDYNERQRGFGSRSYRTNPNGTPSDGYVVMSDGQSEIRFAAEDGDGIYDATRDGYRVVRTVGGGGGGRRYPESTATYGGGGLSLEERKEIIDTLNGSSDEFIQKLLGDFKTRGRLSDKQWSVLKNRADREKKKNSAKKPSGFVDSRRTGGTIAPGARPVVSAGKESIISPTAEQIADADGLEKLVNDARYNGQTLRFNYNGKNREVFPVQTFKNPKTGKINMVGQDAEGVKKTFTIDKMSPFEDNGFGSRGEDRGFASFRDGMYDPDSDPYFDFDDREPDYDATSDDEWDNIPEKVQTEIINDIKEYLAKRDKSAPDNVALQIDDERGLDIREDSFILEIDGIEYVATPALKDEDLFKQLIESGERDWRYSSVSKEDLFKRIKESSDAVSEGRSNGLLTKEEADAIDEEFAKIKSVLDNPQSDFINEFRKSRNKIVEISNNANRRSYDLNKGDTNRTRFEHKQTLDVLDDAPSALRVLEESFRNKRYTGKKSSDEKYFITELEDFAKEAINGEIEYEVDDDGDTRVTPQWTWWGDFEKFADGKNKFVQENQDLMQPYFRNGFASRGDEIPEMRPYSDLTSKEKSDLYESIENYLNGRGDWARIKNELEEGGFDYDDFLQQNPEFHPDFADFGDAGDMGFASRGSAGNRNVQDFESLKDKYGARTLEDMELYERASTLGEAKAELTTAIDEAENMLDGLDEDSPEWERLFNAQQEMSFSLWEIEDMMDEMVSEKERLNDEMGLAATLSGEANDLVETRRGITRPSAEDLDELSFEDAHYEYISLMRDINYLVDENNLSVDWSEEKQSEIEKMLRDGRYEKAEDMLYDVTQEIFDTTDDRYRTAEAEYDDYPFLDSDNLGRYNSGFASRGGSRFDTFETPNSSAIEAVHYDRNTGELHVAFKPGQTGGDARYYTYSGVPADYFDNEVSGSNSIGRVINDVKKNYDVEVTNPRTVDAINGRGEVASTPAKLGSWSTTRGSRTGAILAEGDDYYYTISPDGAGGYRASAYSKRSGSEVDRMGQYETLEAAKAWAGKDYATRTRGTASPSGRSEIQDIDVRRSAALSESYYDPNTEELVVTFKGKDGAPGGSYIYEGVTPDEANELASSSSKGKVINKLKASKSVRRAGADDRMERTPGASDEVGAGGYEAQVDSHWDKIGPEEQRSYFARAVDSAINAGSGTSAEDITADAKQRAYDDRQIAMMEMQAEELGMGYRNVDVGSSAALNRVQYDPSKRELRVEYRGRDGKGTGEFYVYKNVPQSVVDDIEASDSRGATLRRVRDDFEFTTESAIPESAFYSMGDAGDMGERSNPKITNRTNANGFYLDENGRATNYNKRAYTTSDIQKMNARRNGRDGFASGRLGPAPDDAEYGRQLAAQRARDRAAGRNATNPIGNMDRDGEPMDYSVEDGFASRASINESSTGQRIVPSRMHSDDREALAEITDPEERKQRIDELIEFYGPRIFAKPSSPKRKKIVQTYDENGFPVGPDGEPADLLDDDGFASGGVLNEEYDDLREFGYSPEDEAKNDEMVMEAYLNEFDEEAPSLEDAYEFWAQRAQELREERSNSLMDVFSSLRDEVNSLGISDRELGAYNLDGAAFLTAESLIDNPLESDSTDISEAEDYISRMRRSIDQLTADIPEEYDYMDEEPMDGFASGGVDFDRYGNMPSRPKKPRRTGDPSLRNTPKNRARMTAERRLAEMANSGDPEYDNLMQRAKDALSKEGIAGYRLTNEYGEPNSLVAGKMQEILAQDILDGATPKTGGDRPKVDPLSILGGYSDGEVFGLTPRGFASRGASGSKKKSKEEVYAEMTKQLIDALSESEKLGKWQLPWRRTGMPENGTTGHKYSGSNWFFLTAMADVKGYNSNKWATYDQWQGVGGQVRKGEKATSIFVPIFIKGKEKADGTEEKGRVSFISRSVFNLDQIDGMPEDFDKKEILPESERVADLEKTISEIPAVIKNGGDEAYFSPSEDFIQLPLFENFKDARAYYSTAAHELMHWTGGKDRLGRENMNRFGTPEYAYEELVAEIASAMFMSAHNIEPNIQENHGPYLASWIKKLKDDPTALERAMKDAQSAVNYILDISPNAKSKFSNGEKAEFENPDIAVPTEPVVAVEGFASRGDWPTPGGYEPGEFDMRTALSQIGRGNLMAISGTRANKRNNEMVLPVNRNQQVIVGYDGGSDTYFVRAEQIITNGKDKGKTRVLGQWDNVYADELGETAYQASLKPSMLSDDNKVVWAQAFDHPQTGSLLDENGQVYEGGFASGADSMDPDELDAMDWAYDAAQDYLMEQEDMMPEGPSQDDGFASRMNLSTPEKNEIIAIARRMNTSFTRSVVEQYDRNGALSDRQWDALNRMTMRGNRGGFPSRGDDKRPRAPKARWSPEDRQRYADGDKLRSKKRPGKRRDGPSASEYGFASEGETIDVIPTDIFIGDDGSGRSWAFEPIVNRVAKKFGGKENMTDEQLASELGVPIDVARKMRKQGARTRDIYLLDNLRTRVGGGRDMWGVNNDPLYYYDESGNPIFDEARIPDAGDLAPDAPGTRAPRSSTTRNYLDPSAVLEEVGIGKNPSRYSVVKDYADIFPENVWRRILNRGITGEEADTLLKARKSKLTAADLYGDAAGVVSSVKRTDSLPLVDVFSNRAFDSARGRRGFPQQVANAIEEVTGRRPSISTAKNFINNPRSSGSATGRTPLSITPAQLQLLLDKLGISTEEFDKFRSE